METERLPRATLWLLTISALLLALLTFGCGKPVDAHRVRFRFWGDVEEVKIINGLIHDFEAAHPGIHVVAERKPDPSTYADNLMAEFAGHSAPDVIFIDTDRFDVLAASGKFADLSAYLERTRISRPATTIRP